MPATDTVIVYRRAVGDEVAVTRTLGTDLSKPRAVSSRDVLRVADAIVAASA